MTQKQLLWHKRVHFLWRIKGLPSLGSFDLNALTLMEREIMCQITRLQCALLVDFNINSKKLGFNVTEFEYPQTVYMQYGPMELVYSSNTTVVYRGVEDTTKYFRLSSNTRRKCISKFKKLVKTGDIYIKESLI